MSEWQHFSTSDDYAQNYRFLIGAVLPRPIAVVSTLNDDGSFNLAPFSFFNAICPKPMMVSFSPVIRTSDGQYKDTLKNILREREFVINFCTEENYKKVNLASTELPYGQSEFQFAGLTPLPSTRIKAMRMKESPVQFECLLRDVLHYGKNPGGGSLVTGEVVAIHVHQTVLQDGKISSALFKAVARGAGNDWYKTDNPFEVPRLTKNQIQK
jgi:flavin reductase (DIM6/NTAB) family NADH-FMN oxidoreductase RutF